MPRKKVTEKSGKPKASKRSGYKSVRKKSASAGHLMKKRSRRTNLEIAQDTQNNLETLSNLPVIWSSLSDLISIFENDPCSEAQKIVQLAYTEMEKSWEKLQSKGRVSKSLVQSEAVRLFNIVDKVARTSKKVRSQCYYKNKDYKNFVIKGWESLLADNRYDWSRSDAEVESYVRKKANLFVIDWIREEKADDAPKGLLKPLNEVDQIVEITQINDEDEAS